MDVEAVQNIELVDGDTASDRELFARLFERHYDEIHAFCARRVQLDAAPDVVADVFAVVWRRIAEIPAHAERGWIYGVARGVIRNRRRSDARRTNLVEKVRRIRAADDGGPEQIVVANDEGAPVRAALEHLRPADQEILMLAAWEELTGPEIAVALDLSLSAVQQRLSRAKRRLAEALAEHGGAAVSRGGRHR